MPTFTNNSTGISELWRRMPDGTTKLVAVDRSEYIEPKVGSYVLRLTGLSDPFEMDDTYNPDGGKKNMVRIEVEVVQPPKRSGQRWSELERASIHEKSTLGKIFRAISKQDIPRGANIEGNDYLNGIFMAMVVMNEKGTRTKIGSDSILPYDDEDDEGPILVGAGTTKNPFTDQE